MSALNPSFSRADLRSRRCNSVRIGVPVTSVFTFGKNGAHSLKPSRTARTNREVILFALPGMAGDSWPNGVCTRICPPTAEVFEVDPHLTITSCAVHRLHVH